MSEKNKATISKVQLKSGVRYRARIKQGGKVIASKTFKTKTNARTWVKRIEGDVDRMSALGSKGASITFNNLAREYIDQWNGRDTDHPRRVDWWVTRLDDIKIIDIDADILDGYLKAYVSGKVQQWCGATTTGFKVRELDKPRKPATVNRMHAAVSSVLRYAVKERYLRENVARQIPSLTEDNKRQRYLSDSEREALLRACDDSTWPKLRLLVVMALTTGCRRGELLGLTWDSIDFKARTAYLARTKNGDARVVPLANVTIAELTKWREVGAGLVFPSVIKPNKPFEYEKHWYKAMKDAGIEGFHFHDLRHSAASMLVNSDVPLYTVGQILGHRNQQTTARYAHLNIETKQAAIDSVMDNMGIG